MDSFEAGLKKSYLRWGDRMYMWGDHIIPVPYKVRGDHNIPIPYKMWGDHTSHIRHEDTSH